MSGRIETKSIVAKSAKTKKKVLKLKSAGRPLFGVY